MLADTLLLLGYRTVDDEWDKHARRTYLHDDDATNAVIRILRGILGAGGWRPHECALRTFRHDNGELIEIEPGGADTSGHYLHHMKAEVVA